MEKVMKMYWMVAPWTVVLNLFDIVMNPLETAHIALIGSKSRNVREISNQLWGTERLDTLTRQRALRVSWHESSF